MRRSFVLMLVVGAALCLLVPQAQAQFNGDMTYSTGPRDCMQCHEQAYFDWLAHGHSRKIGLAFEYGPDTLATGGKTTLGVRRQAEGWNGATANVRSQGFPLPTHDPEVYNWDNVLFVVGASKYWKTRFVGNDGYFLTKNGMNQYNWATGEWVNYNADVEMKPFDCGSCHTTGYDPDGTYFNDRGIPGVEGDFAHINITCEACHGPAAEHVAESTETEFGGTIIGGEDIDAAACGQCHTRGDDPDVILASGGFIRHHEQWPEHNNGPHFFLDCSSCHNAHVGRYEGVTIDSTCGPTCHRGEADDYAESAMDLAGVKCIDCHMGRATRSARANGPYEGDVWTHLFRINSEENYDMFNRDDEGNTVSAKDAISLEFACFRCHAAADKAAFADIDDYHTLGKE